MFVTCTATYAGLTESVTAVPVAPAYDPAAEES